VSKTRFLLARSLSPWFSVVIVPRNGLVAVIRESDTRTASWGHQATLTGLAVSRASVAHAMGHGSGMIAEAGSRKPSPACVQLEKTQPPEALTRDLDFLVGEQARELGLEDKRLNGEIEAASLIESGESAGNLG